MQKRICPKCGKPAYSSIEEDDWECPHCGVTIPKEGEEGMDLIKELNLPNTQAVRDSIAELEKKYTEKEISEAITFAKINGRNDFAYVKALLNISQGK